MKRNFEDKLAQLAFGELDSQEAVKVEQEISADPKALRALSMYKDMRDGLRELSEVPEDQFSNERLRDAILKQGLRPAAPRPSSRWSWLWMPAAAAAMGFCLITVLTSRHRQTREPQIVMGPIHGLSRAGEVPIRVTADFRYHAPSDPFVKPKAAVQKVAAAESMRDPNEADARLTANTDMSAYDPDLGSIPASINTHDTTGGTVVMNSPESKTPVAAAGSSEPIVLIEQDTDEQTGACKATEVGSSSNVLVGG